MVKGKHILIGVGVAALAFGVPYVMKLKRLSAELETETKASIHKVRLDGIELKVEVKMKNPTGGSITVKHPFVKMIYGESTFATSQVKDRDITIEKFSEVMLPPIFLRLDFITLARTVPAMLQAYRKEGKVSLTVKTISTLNGSIPYEKLDVIEIGKGLTG